MRSHGKIIVLQSALVVVCICSARAAETAVPKAAVVPQELTDAALHNPDTRWALYENYPLDQDPHVSSTLLTLPNENFAGVDVVKR